MKLDSRGGAGPESPPSTKRDNFWRRTASREARPGGIKVNSRTATVVLRCEVPGIPTDTKRTRIGGPSFMAL